MFSKFTTAGCVCVFSSHSFWTSSSLDVPAGVTQEEGHTLLHTLKCCCTLLENRGTYLSSQSPGVSIHHSTIIARVISLLLVLYYRAGRPGSSEVPRNPLTRWDVSSIPANGIFLKLKNKNKNAQRVENDQIVSTQNSTSRSTKERNG